VSTPPEPPVPTPTPFEGLPHRSANGDGHAPYVGPVCKPPSCGVPLAGVMVMMFLAGHLTGFVGLGVLAVLVGPKHEIVGVHGDLLAVLRLDFNLGDEEVALQVRTTSCLIPAGLCTGRGQDQIFVLALGGRSGLLGTCREQESGKRQRGENTALMRHLRSNYTARENV